MARIAYLNTYGNGSTGKIVDLLKSLSLENGIDVNKIEIIFQNTIEC